MRTIVRFVVLGLALVAHATNAETGEDLTFKPGSGARSRVRPGSAR